MGILEAAIGLALVLFVLWDTFETIVMPRTVDRSWGLTRAYYHLLWQATRPVILRLKCRPARREALLGVFGPLSLISLIGVWALLLILGFGLLTYGLQVPLSTSGVPQLGSYLYMSAVTFFTLGYGDLTATTGLGRTILVAEAGTGFGFLAIVISYIPVLYQAFSRREAAALLLDARAGSPPAAGELLRRCGGPGGRSDLERILQEFERWSAQLLESYLSYPVLAMYRSQHEMLGWIPCLCCILDACVLIESCWEVRDERDREIVRQAELTFAMGRHLAVDVAYILNIAPQDPPRDRLPDGAIVAMLQSLAAAEVPVRTGEPCAKLVRERRASYEPYLQGLSDQLASPLPEFSHTAGVQDSWQTTAWDELKHF